MGILINTGFDLGSSSPIDSRTLKDTIDERDALMYEGKVYENLKVYCKDTQKEYRWTGTEWETVGSSSGGDLTDYQKKTDNTLETTDKTVTGAINEINGNLLDTVGFSADYKNIILNRKSGLNPYTIPISAIINNTSLAELKDIDSTDIGNGKTLVYDSSIQKHIYVDTTGTDEFVKMDSTTDANYLSELIDKSTVINDKGVLKVKKLDGQEVTITEINYLKGLTMNIMDLVNAFANGGVKVLNTPLNTASELDTMDRTSFIEGISYIVYVLADETHAGAKTTYLVDKTNTTFFGNADSQRNFTTNPIDLANEVTGKLGTSNIDVDSLWSLLTINDTYKTLTTNNEIFGTHGAKAMYDELTTSIGKKANATDFNSLKTTVDGKIDKTNAKLVQLENNQIKKLTLQNQSQKEFYIKIAACNGDNFSKILFTDSYGGSILITGGIITGVDYKTIKVVRLTNGDWTSYNPSTNTLNKIQNVYLGGTDIYIKCGPYTTFYIEGGFISAEKVNSIPSDVTQLPILDLTQQTDSTAINTNVPKTTLTPDFPGEVKVGSGGATISYVVKNGWCNVNFEFNLASATTCSWTSIATGLPKPANNANILLTDESGKINRSIAIKITSNGLVASRIPVAFTAVDWWRGNISYPVAE